METGTRSGHRVGAAQSAPAASPYSPPDSQFAGLWSAARAAHAAAVAYGDEPLRARTREAVAAVARAVARYELLCGREWQGWTRQALEVESDA